MTLPNSKKRLVSIKQPAKVSEICSKYIEEGLDVSFQFSWMGAPSIDPEDALFHDASLASDHPPRLVIVARGRGGAPDQAGTLEAPAPS